MNALDEAIYNTVRYFDIIGLPVTITQIWGSLLVPQDGGARRLSEVRQRIEESQWLQERLDTKWGYVVLKGKREAVAARLTRHVIAQQKWKTTKRAARFLSAMPFIRGLAGSGSLALFNTHQDSDLDLFIITKKNRIWTARLFLLLISELMGRRRKYWDRKAPDKVCLNHYVTDGQLAMPKDVQNIYTAVQYSLHMPIYGENMLRKFQKENASWISRYVCFQPRITFDNALLIKLPELLREIKDGMEKILLEPIGDGFEYAAKRIQQFFILRHKKQGQAGRLVFSDTELAFHPDTKVPGIVGLYSRNIR